jgi:multiple sugar transport system substrate-binding protein
MRKIILVLLLLLPLIMSCQKQHEPQEPVVEPVTLKVWIMPNSATPEQDFLQLIDPFLKENTHITVSVEVIQWDAVWVRLSGAAVGGENAPDIAQIGSTLVASLAALNAFAPVDEIFSQRDFVEASLETTSLRGETKKIAVPWFLDTRVLFYNKEIIEKAGVDPEKDFETWATFKQTLRKLSQVEIEGEKVEAFVMPGKNDWNVLHFFAPWVWSGGGSFISDDLQRSNIDSPESLNGIYFYSELLQDGLLSKNTIMNNTQQIGDYFFNGNAAVTIASINTTTTYDFEISERFGATLVPAGPKGRQAFLGGSNLSVFKASQNKEAAKKLLLFLTEDEPQRQYSQMIRLLPATKSALEDPFYENDQIWRVHKQQLQFGRQYPNIPAWGVSEGMIVSSLSEIWDNVSEVNGSYSRNKTKQILSDLAKKIDNAIEETNTND